MIITERLENYLMKQGKEYEPALLPVGVTRGEMGQCFDNCVVRALDSDLKYVEGIAASPITGEWILHAWLTDGVHAFDPTWRSFFHAVERPVPTLYLGVEMDIDKVARFMLATKYAGVIANARRYPEVAEDILPGILDII